VTSVTVGSSTPPPSACQVGTGTDNLGVPLTLYLVQAPSGHTSDIAGLDLFAGTPLNVNAAVGDVTVRTTDGGLNIAFSGLTLPGLTTLSTTFNHADLRMPSSCPGENFSASADSQATPFAASPAFTTTGCSSLAYNPTVSATVKKDASDTGAEVISTISQPNAATESSTKAITLGFGTLSPNTVADLPCLTGTPCNVGTATATSPVVPALAFSGGTVTLGPPVTTPTLTIMFPLLHVALVGTINLTNNTVTFNPVPDFPLSSLAVDVTGPSGQKAFTTTCSPSNVSGAFTPWSGGAVVNRSVAVTYQGCPSGGGTPGNPTGSGSISGLKTGHPTLHFLVTHGSNAPNISSVSIGPSQGLSFRKCVKKGKKHLCSGVSVSGSVKSEKISGGRLTIVMSSSASSVSVTASGAAVTESKSLLKKAKKGKVKTITFTIKVKDANGTTSVVKAKLKAS
jgi:hypothetical protein